MSVRVSGMSSVRELVADVHVVVPERGGRAHACLREARAEPGQLRARAAQRVLDLLAPQEVAVHGVVDVGAHAAVEVLRDVHRRAGRPRTPTTWPPSPRAVASSPSVSRHAACHSVTRIASVSMYASAALSATPWNVDSGLPNCWRCDVYSAAMRSAPSATPTCIAHSPTSARSSVHASARRRRSPPPSRSAGAPASSRCATFDRSVVGARRCARRRRPAGSTRNTPSRRRRSTAGTSTRSATWPAGTLGLRAVEPPAVAVARRGDLRAQRVVGAGLGERGGEHDLAADDARAATPRCCSGVPNSAIGSAPSTSVGQQRHGRDACGPAARAAGTARRARARCRRAPRGRRWRAGRRRRARATARGRCARRSRSTSFTRSTVAWPVEDLRRRGRGRLPAPRRT